jgi:hypothetical protein
MGPHELAVHSANTADSTARSRLKKKLMQTPEWENMTEKDRRELLNVKTAELARKRYLL